MKPSLLPVLPHERRSRDGSHLLAELVDAMVEAIHSGGQTGADQGGLAAAVTLGLPTGGWVPKGYRVRNSAGKEDTAPWLANLGLKEHESRDYPPRTKLNVASTDGTVIFGFMSPVSGPGRGSWITKEEAARRNKPYCIVPWFSGQPVNTAEIRKFRQWVADNDIRVLNVAGNCECDNRGITIAVHDFLVKALLGRSSAQRDQHAE